MSLGTLTMSLCMCFRQFTIQQDDRSIARPRPCIQSTMRRAIGLLVCALFLCATPALYAQAPQAPALLSMRAAYGQKVTVTGIRNFGKISDQLYRGGQPNTAGIEQLKKLGITTIVDLRREDVAGRDREKREAEAAGIRFVNIPVGGWNAPADDQVAEFLSIFADPKQKVFVHCHFGEDRTGVFVAAYRMETQQWSVSQAIQEMHFFGFNAFWHHAMTAFVMQFPTVLSSPAFAMPHGSKPASLAQAN